MLKRTAVRSAAQAVAQDRFDGVLRKICDGKQRIGMSAMDLVGHSLIRLCERNNTDEN